MRLSYSYQSHTGLVRANNQDAFTVDPLADRSDAALLLVADGMGGHQGGEIASQLAVQTVRAAVLAGAARWAEQGELEQGLAVAIERANQVILQAQREQPGHSTMGTTLTAALIWGRQVVIGHIGDSKAVFVRSDGSLGATQDHNVASELLQSGHLTAEEAAVHPQRHILTRALGTDEQILIDTLTEEWRQGEVLLLCTDGLTNLVSLQEMQSLVAESFDPLLADRLIALANARGGHDNITVVAARWEG